MESEPFNENFICIDISTCWFSDVCIINLYFMLLLLLLVLSNVWCTFVKRFSNEASCRSVILEPKITNYIYTYHESLDRQNMAHSLPIDFKNKTESEGAAADDVPCDVILNAKPTTMPEKNCNFTTCISQSA
jgi:hypothetical protein